MDPSAIPPALRNLVDRGDGVAEIVDPETNRVFVVTEETPIEVTLPEEYVRQKLDEARADLAAGRVSTRSTEEILAAARRRHEADRSAKPSS